MSANKAISERLRQWGEEQFGSMAELARQLDLRPQELYRYLSGSIAPGNKLQAKLRNLGCDIEWLMTGNKSEQARGDPAAEEMMAALKEAGITSPKQLRDLLAQHEQLRRSLGPAAYQTVLEIARVAEHRGKYGGRKRRLRKG